MANYTTPYFSSLMKSRQKTGADFLGEYNSFSPQGLDLKPSSGKYTDFSLADSSAKKESFLNNMDYGQLAAGIGQGFSSYAEGAADTYNFSVDPNAGFKGSAKGFASMGAIGAIVGGVMGQIGTFSQVNRNLKKLDTTVDLDGEGGYQAGAYLGAMKNIRSLDDGLKSTKKGIDVATSMFDNVFGTSDKIWKKRQELSRNIAHAQDDFNTRRESYDKQRMAIDEYFDRMNNVDNLYNMYR